MVVHPVKPQQNAIAQSSNGDAIDNIKVGASPGKWKMDKNSMALVTMSRRYAH
jgi:hypothetical protein